MLNVKLLTQSLLISSFLASLSSAYAMEKEDRGSLEKDRWGNTTIKVSLLQKGYELGKKDQYLELKDGKFLVTKTNPYSSNPYYGSEPYFPPHLDTVHNCSTEKDTLCFSHAESHPGMKHWNPVTQQFEMVGGGFMEYFRLSLKPIKEAESSKEPTIEISSDKKAAPIFINTNESSSTVNKNDLISQANEETLEKKKTKYTIFKEPAKIENKAAKTFYTAKDPHKDLYYGIELLTSESVNWWRYRLGAEAYMQFGRAVEHDRMMQAQVTDEQRLAQAESERAYSEFLRGPGRREKSFHQAFYVSEDTFVSMAPFQVHTDAQYVQVCNNKGMAPLGEGKDYLGAWNGFRYNLNLYNEVPTWISYVCSSPIEEPLYKSMSVTSPKLKMAMTVQMSDTFCGFLGLHSSTISQAFAMCQGETHPKQISMPFFSATARFVKEINEDVKKMAFRPLESVRRIVKKSGVPFSQSSIWVQNINIPYVRFTYDRYGKQEEMFGDSLYVLVDPRSNEVTQIDPHHWFSQNPFVGGRDREIVLDYPIVTMDIESLANYSK